MKSNHSPYCISFNKKAKHSYTLEKKYTAGIQLFGWEVGSLRHSKSFQINEAYVKECSGELWLHNTTITPALHCSNSCINQIDSQRPRKLLLTRKEITQIVSTISKSRFTFIPVEVYWSNRMIKVSVWISIGKTNTDKRKSIKERELQRHLREHRES